MSEINNLKPESAKELADAVLGWAKRHNLFSRSTLDDAVDETEAAFEVPGAAFRAHAAEEILRKRSINLVTFDDPTKQVTIFTHTKVSKSDEKLLPFNVGGYQISYMQGGVPQVKGNPPPPQNPRPFYLHGGRYTCGSSIFPAHCVGAGTFGALVRSDDGSLMGLTNNHVSGACNHAMPGLPILAPGPLDCNDEACDPFTIGRHQRLLPINDGIPENIAISENWDVSLFSIADADKVTSMQGTHYDTPSRVGSLAGGMRVRKVGRTTGLTEGMVVGQSASPVPVAYNVNEYGVKKTVFFEKVFVVEGDNSIPFSRPGDSGSLVVGNVPGVGEAAVGLVFAGNEMRNLSFILPLDDTLRKLNVTLVADHNA